MGNTPEQKQTIIEQVKSTTTAESLKTTLEQKGAKTKLWEAIKNGLGDLKDCKDCISENSTIAIKSIYDNDNKKEYPVKGTKEYKEIQALAALHFAINDGDIKYSFKPGKLAEEQAKSYIDEVALKPISESENISSKEEPDTTLNKVTVQDPKTIIQPKKIIITDNLKTKVKNIQDSIANTVSKNNITQKIQKLKEFVGKVTGNNKLQQGEVRDIGKSIEFQQSPYEDIISLLSIKNDKGELVSVDRVFNNKGQVDSSLSFVFNGLEVKNRAKDDLVKIILGKKIGEKGSNDVTLKNLSEFTTQTTDSRGQIIITQAVIADQRKVYIVEKGELVEKVIITNNNEVKPTIESKDQQEDLLSIPNKLKSNPQIKEIITDLNFISIFKSLKKQGYQLSIQIKDEGKRQESLELQIIGNNQNIKSNIGRLPNKMDFVDIIKKIPSGDLALVQSQIIKIEKQIAEKNQEETNKKNQEKDQNNNIMKQTALQAMKQVDFWIQDNYLDQRQNLANLLNQKDQNNNYIINDQELKSIKQSIINFVGKDKIIDIDKFTIGKEDNLKIGDKSEIIVYGKDLKNRSISDSAKVKIKNVKETNTQLDITKIGLNIDESPIDKNEAEKGKALKDALNRVLGENNYIMSSSNGFTNFSLKLNPIPNLYYNDQKVKSTDELLLDDNTKAIEIKGNQIIITNFNTMKKDVLEIKKQ